MTRDPDHTVEFAFDRRGVSEVIGSILVFGLLVSLLSVVQLQAVPEANSEVEFEHSQRVQGDMSRLAEVVSRTGARGASESVSVELGTGYPPRLVFYNPPDAAGTLRTTDSGRVRIENAVATNGETADFLDGSVNGAGSATLNTSLLVYEPSYNLYDEAPETVIEYGMLYDSYNDTDRVEDAGAIVNGRRISLTFFAGGYDESGVTPASITTKAVSAPTRTVTVTDDGTGNPLTIEIPTRLNETVWIQEVLADEIDDADGGSNGAGVEPSDTACTDISGTPTNNDRFVVGCTYANGNITLVFQEDTNYELRTSKVALGDTPPSTGAHYVTIPDGSSNISVPTAGSDEVTVEVRDKYNNPVSGATLEVQPLGEGTVVNQSGATAVSGDPVLVTTNAEGQATAQFNANLTNDAQVEFAFQGSITQREQVLFNMSVGALTAEPIILEDTFIDPDGDGTPGTGGNITLELNNTGETRNISAIEVGHITINDRQGTLTSNATQLVDGPDSVEIVRVGSEEVDLATPAVETQGRSPVGSGALMLPGGNTATNVTLSLNEKYNGLFSEGALGVSRDDSIIVHVEITYSDGHTETYDFVRFEDE